MAAPLIPMRPKFGKFNLKAEEMDCINWILLSGCTREDAFLKFVRPDYAGSRAAAAVKAAVKQFFAMSEVKDYIEAYRSTIEDFSKPKAKPESGNLEDRKAKSKAKLVEFAMELVDNIENADDPEFVLKVADKCQLLDVDEEVVEQPRRYLPVSCGLCEYRKFVEENCEMVDDEISQ